MIIKVCFMSLLTTTTTTTTTKNPNTNSSRGEEISDLHGSARLCSLFFWFTVGKLCSVYTHSLLGCVVLFRLWQATWRDFSIKVCLLPFTKLRGPRWGTTLSLTNSTLRCDIKTVQTTTTAATTGPNGFWFLSGQRVEGRKMLKGLS